MMRHAANQRDPYNYPYRDSYGYRDHRDPAGYRDTSGHWDPYEYRDAHSHRDAYARESSHYRESAGHRAAADAGPSGQRAVSNVTNSDDFASKDSRVFVGNLNTVVLGKEEVNAIFGRLGRVTGISMHKGYAFVQFSSPGEARRALALENGQTYGGQALDLNIVSQPKIKSAPKRSADLPSPDGYNRASSFEESPATKRPRPEGNPSMQRGNLVTLANSDHSHASSSRPGPRQEPQEIGCAQCDAVFSSAWSLCLHFQQRHNTTIFRTKIKNGR